MRRAPITKPHSINGKKGHVIVDEFFAMCRPTHQPVFRSGTGTRCTACGASQWLVGRLNAECALCGATAGLPEAGFTIPLPAKPKG